MKRKDLKCMTVAEAKAKKVNAPSMSLDAVLADYSETLTMLNLSAHAKSRAGWAVTDAAGNRRWHRKEHSWVIDADMYYQNDDSLAVFYAPFIVNEALPASDHRESVKALIDGCREIETWMGAHQ